MPFLLAFAAVLGLWVVAGVSTGHWSILKYVEGADGRASTSKFQWLFWTVVVFFAYTAAYVARARYGYLEQLPSVPQNLLILMGISAGTMAGAKAITQTQVNQRKIVKAAPDPRDQQSGMGALVNDDDAVPDLTKIQMLGWSLLIAAIYLSRVVQMVHAYDARDNDLTQLPDIDTALMVLMGVGHGGYLAKKSASAAPPQAAVHN